MNHYKKTSAEFTRRHIFLKNGEGFTLIETLIYIACLSALLASLLGITYQAIASADQINKKMILQQESNFISAKINWALTGAKTVSTSTTPSFLSITRYSAPALVVFSQNGNFIDINSGSGAMDLNSINTKISNLVFATSQVSGQHLEVQTSFTLTLTNDAAQSQSFQMTKYLR
jgi:type II secretory pathway pseudopilin PulG